MSRSVAGWLWRSIAGALAVSSAFTFAGLYALGRSDRIEAFEQALRDDLRTIANITQTFPDDDLYVNLEPESLTEYQPGGGRFFVVWDVEDGELIDQSPSLESLGSGFDRPPVAELQPRRAEALLPDGRAVSLIWQRTWAHWGLDPELLRRTGLTVRDREVLLLVGRSRAELAGPLNKLALACAAGAFALPLLAAVLLLLLVPRALRPINELGRAIATRPADRHEPFPPSAVLEMQPIVERLNELMHRIDQQRQRERRFLSDAAHELRSPLAELHALADMALLEHDDAPMPYRSVLSETKDVVRRLAHRVDALFQLARRERAELREEPLRLRGVVEAALTALAAMPHDGAPVRWQLHGDPDATVTSDALLLRTLLDNLLRNVILHAPAGGAADITWHGAPAPQLCIVNPCRTGAAGAAGQDRLGIGLTIARVYANALGARLSAARCGDSFEVRIDFGTAAVTGGDNAAHADAPASACDQTA
jgi:two-component system, OmpR family, sensor histidine kinase QseC